MRLFVTDGQAPGNSARRSLGRMVTIVLWDGELGDQADFGPFRAIAAINRRTRAD